MRVYGVTQRRDLRTYEDRGKPRSKKRSRQAARREIALEAA